jgi:hypothetical protein
VELGTNHAVAFIQTSVIDKQIYYCTRMTYPVISIFHICNHHISPVPAPISMAVTPPKSDDLKLLCNTKSANSKADFQTYKTPLALDHNSQMNE